MEKCFSKQIAFAATTYIKKYGRRRLKRRWCAKKSPKSLQIDMLWLWKMKELSQKIYLESCHECVCCFCNGEVHSFKCERRVQARGLARSIIRIITIRCKKNSLSKIFHVINFRSLMQLQKFFSNKNFPIYGTYIQSCAQTLPFRWKNGLVN